MSVPIAVTDATYREMVFTSREPVLVAFMAEADSTCRALRPILADLARERAGRLNVATIDVAANPTLADSWGITQVPIMLLFHQGVLQRVLRGVRPYARLVQEIDDMPTASFGYAAL
jgi:thioredoxin 1